VVKLAREGKSNKIHFSSPASGKALQTNQAIGVPTQNKQLCNTKLLRSIFVHLPLEKCLFAMLICSYMGHKTKESWMVRAAARVWKMRYAEVCLKMAENAETCSRI
jgi:hypothetical protein